MLKKLRDRTLEAHQRVTSKARYGSMLTGFDPALPGLCAKQV